MNAKRLRLNDETNSFWFEFDPNECFEIKYIYNVSDTGETGYFHHFSTINTAPLINGFLNYTVVCSKRNLTPDELKDTVETIAMVLEFLLTYDASLDDLDLNHLFSIHDLHNKNIYIQRILIDYLNFNGLTTIENIGLISTVDVDYTVH